MNYASDGSLRGYDPCDIADAAMWEGDPQQFIDSLLNCGVGDRPGFIDRDSTGNLAIHDWQDYIGKLLDKRKTDAERKKEFRKTSLGHPSDIQQTSKPTADGHPPDGAGTVPTVPTVPKDQEKESIKKKILTPKTLFGEFVLLTQDERQKLVDRFGQEQTSAMVEILDNKIGENPKRKPYCDYASHYRVLLGWVLQEWQRRHPLNKRSPDNFMKDMDGDFDALRFQRERMRQLESDRSKG